MIRFKCIYCGQRILASDDGIGKKGKCPKCKHELRVPKTTIGRPAISSEKTEPMQYPADTASKGYLCTDDLAELCKEKAGWFIPVYDELSLFLMAITLILLFVTNTSFQEQIHKWNERFSDSRIFIAGVILLAGMGLSIYHVFTTREKTGIEKWIMLLFAVLTNAGTGIISGWYVLNSSPIQNWQIIFPMWNIINGVLLLLMLRLRIIDEECISDRDATAGEVIRGLFAVIVIFIFCNYVFKLHWAITFSICIIYATSFDKALQSIFPALTYRKNE
jgi:DNA-directed RNA polymerase subunit RPC12/RpoP